MKPQLIIGLLALQQEPYSIHQVSNRHIWALLSRQKT